MRYSGPDPVCRSCAGSPGPTRVFKESVPRSLVQALLMEGEDPRLGDLKRPFASIALDLVTGRLFVYSSRSDPQMSATRGRRHRHRGPRSLPAARERSAPAGRRSARVGVPAVARGGSCEPRSTGTLDPVLALKTEARGAVVPTKARPRLLDSRRPRRDPRARRRHGGCLRELRRADDRDLVSRRRGGLQAHERGPRVPHRRGASTGAGVARSRRAGLQSRPSAGRALRRLLGRRPALPVPRHAPGHGVRELQPDRRGAAGRDRRSLPGVPPGPSVAAPLGRHQRSRRATTGTGRSCERCTGPGWRCCSSARRSFRPASSRAKERPFLVDAADAGVLRGALGECRRRRCLRDPRGHQPLPGAERGQAAAP